MKKVGIMSMQRVANYGSFLQAYGLKKMIEKEGVQVEFIDYNVESCVEGVDIKKRGYISKVLKYIKMDAPLKQRIGFILHKYNYHKKYDKLLGITKQRNYNAIVDVLVIGSDEVFNCTQANDNVGFSRELFGYNCNAKKLVSYAASFGNTTVEKLKYYHIFDEVKSLMNKFDYISVRDKNSFDVVEALTGQKSKQHLDPVLIYDFYKECNRIPKHVPEENYILLYAYPGRISRYENEAIRKYAREKGKKVLCIGGAQKCGDKFIDCSPFEVLAYFKNADYIITDTFHGSIMSVISRRPFATLIRNSSQNGYGNEEKLSDLLFRLELSGQRLDSIDDLDVVLNHHIDYDVIHSIIDDERIRTKEYLSNILRD